MYDSAKLPNDGEIAGSVDHTDFFFSTVGQNEGEIIDNITSQIADFLNHEGTSKTHWKGVNAKEIEFNLEYE